MNRSANNHCSSILCFYIRFYSMLSASLISAIIKLPCEHLRVACLRGKLYKRLWSLYRLLFWPNHLAGRSNNQDLGLKGSWGWAMERRWASRAVRLAGGQRALSISAKSRGTAAQTHLGNTALCQAEPWDTGKTRGLRKRAYYKPHSLTHSAESFVKPPTTNAKDKRKQLQGKHPPAAFELEENEVLCILKSFVPWNNVLVLVKQSTPGKSSSPLFPALQRVCRVEEKLHC